MGRNGHLALYVLAAVLFAAVSAATAGAAGINVFIGVATIPSSGPFANVWVDSNGGTCTRGPSAAYVDAAACSTLDAAWDAASAGDTIRVKANVSTYGAQTITGSKLSETTIIGETTGSGVTLGTTTVSANFVTLQDMTVQAGATHGSGGVDVGADNITFNNMSVRGPYVALNIGARNGFTWRGGEFGHLGDTPGKRSCVSSPNDNGPLELRGTTNTLIDGVTFYPQDFDATTGAGCSTGFHLEYFRLDNGGGGFTMKNSVFPPTQQDGTAEIFITNPTGSSSYTGFTLLNNFFGDTLASAGVFNVHPNVPTCTSFTFAYNTYVATPGTWGTGQGCTTATSWLWAGNLGPYASSSPCTGTHTKNLWQYNLSGSCGTDVWVIGPAFGVGNLGFSTSTGLLSAGSPAINAGENTQCTGLITNLDRLGATRTGVCDAGSDEF